MVQSSRTFRIFVSSTFSDLKAERNALQEQVFPRLRELAAAHGCRFQAIDLRWGVSEEAALDQQTLKICLGEIERCQKTSPRPNFIVLLGNRYGWRPVPSEIPAGEFERIIPRVDGQEKVLLEQWYRRDDNAVPAVYCLQPRNGEFVEYSAWEKVENSLRAIFLSAIKKLALPPEAALKYSASATEQEIVAGALQVRDASEHVFCFLRDIEGMPEDGSAAGFREADPEATQKQVELKKTLKQQLLSNVHEYTAYWQGEGPTMEHLKQFCEDVYNDLSRVILVEAGKLEKFDPLEAEITAHEAFGKERAQVFIGRTNVLKTIEEYIAGSDPHLLAVWGESGCGKSALMAKAVEQAQHNGKEVLYRYVGATPESSNGRALLGSLCLQISRRYGADESTIPSEYKDLVQEFPKRLALATMEKPLALFLDALDQLSDTNNARSLIWLPASLPPNVRLAVSTLPGECLQTLESKAPTQNHLEVQSMQAEDGRAILEAWFAGIHRKLQENQEKYLLEKFKDCGLPLYLKLAFEEARQWKSFDSLSQLSGDIPGILQDLFKRLSLESNHGTMLVARSLGYLAAARNGLSEDELLDVLSIDQEMLADFQRRSPKSPKVERLPVVIWSRLYFDLESYLTERSADGTSLLAFYHTTSFTKVIINNFLSRVEKKKRHLNLADYFNDQPLYRRSSGIKIPNLRKLSEMVYQQAWAGLGSQVEKTLLDFLYMGAKLAGQGAQELIEDYTLVPNAGLSKEKEVILSLLQDALQLSKHVLEKDQYQLPNQLTGRLLSFENSEIKALLKQIQESATRPWLRPLTQCFSSPGGPLIFTLAGHTQPVEFVSFTPDGKRVVSGSNDKTLKVWDLESGKEIFTLSGHTDSIIAFEVSPDGKKLVSASSDKTFKVWDLQSGKEIYTRAGHNLSSGIIITQDSQKVISASGIFLEIWDIENGNKIFNLGENDFTNSVNITPDGRKVVAGSFGKTLKVWDLESGKLLFANKGQTDQVRIARDGSKVFSFSYENTLKVLELETGKELYRLAGLPDIGRLNITPDGRRVVSACGDKSLKVWDIETGKVIFTLPGHTDFISSVEITPDGKVAVSAAGVLIPTNENDTTVKVWDLEKGKEIQTLKEHTGKVLAARITPDGSKVISASEDTTLKVWNLTSKVAGDSQQGHTGPVEAVRILADTALAVSGSVDNTLKVWNIKTGQELHTLVGHKGWVKAVSILPDGRKAVSASNDNTLKVWDLESGQELHTLLGHNDWVNAVSITPDGRKAVSVSEDRTGKVWDLESGRELYSLQGHRNALYAVSITPDGKKAVTAGGSQELPSPQVTRFPGQAPIYNSPDNSLFANAIKVWDLENGREIHTMKGHTRAVIAVSTTPDGKKAVSASWDNTIKLWDLESGMEINSVMGLPGIIGMSMTPDGRKAVSFSRDDSLQVWDLEKGKEIYTLKFRELGSERVSNVKSGHISKIDTLCISIDGNEVGFASYEFNLWDLRSGKLISAFYGDDYFHCCGIGNNGNIVVGGRSGKLYFLQKDAGLDQQAFRT